MTQLATTPAVADQSSTAGAVRGSRPRIGAAFALVVAVVVGLCAVHLTQGTSTVGLGDLVDLTLGRGDDLTRDVFVGSRLPRLLAGLIVGAGVGMAGVLLQSIARNPLASPDTLAVNAGAYLTVALVAVLGINPPVLASGAVAFLGGLAAAGLVLALSGGTSGPARIVLAGSATALALGSATGLLLILFEESTRSLFVWGNGTLVQLSLDAPLQTGATTAVALVVVMLLGRRLDLLALGDDAAVSLGVNVRLVRLLGLGGAVLLAALAVTVAGPIGFVGLCAPVLARLSGRWVPGVHRHHVLLPVAGLIGVLIVLAADIAVRALPSSAFGDGVPTGVVTSLVGAVVLVVVARNFRQAGPTREAPAARARSGSPGRHAAVVAVVLAALVMSSLLLGLLAGDDWLLLGDLVNAATGRAGPFVQFSVEERLPRLLAATFAGGALALAGCATQAVCRNPLAEPGLLGITAGAGVGAVAVIGLVTSPALWMVNVAAVLGAFVAFGLVYSLAWRDGLDSIRLILVGVGVWTGGTALIALLVIATNPWSVQFALTWLSGSSYGRTLAQVVPVAVMVAAAVPVLLAHRRDLDVMALDDDTPRVLGIRLERTRLVVLVTAALLTATAAAAMGIVAFVGLVAPHAARAIVGSRHSRVIPVALLLGMLLVGLADTVGRSVIAPAQVPAGLVTALLGTPYFVWLLWRTRA